MDTEKKVTIGLLGIGIFSIIVCFFLNTAEFSENKLVCEVTFIGNLECELQGVKVKLELGDCNGDLFCQTIKTTPIHAGLSFGFGIITLILILVSDKIPGNLSQTCVKRTILSTLTTAIALALLIPILYAANKYFDVTLKVIPLVFEGIAILSYGIAWVLIAKQKQQKQGTLLT